MRSSGADAVVIPEFEGGELIRRYAVSGSLRLRVVFLLQRQTGGDELSPATGGRGIEIR
jgi:hypothetical protein